MALYFVIPTWFVYKWESEIIVYFITQGFCYVNNCFYSFAVLRCLHITNIEAWAEILAQWSWIDTVSRPQFSHWQKSEAGSSCYKMWGLSMALHKKSLECLNCCLGFCSHIYYHHNWKLINYDWNRINPFRIRLKRYHLFLLKSILKPDFGLDLDGFNYRKVHSVWRHIPQE